MDRRGPRTPLLTSLLLVSLAAVATTTTLSQGCDGGERRALLRSIKPLFTGEFGYRDVWNESTDCCAWEGVVCGGVVSLSLVQAGIAGAVDGGVFAAFTALQELDLSWNRITAFSLPSPGDFM
uniref:Leucine-rich repeat-containing N-terminal plant-type domain-containing protein n=1 Tax=Oryza punctata TaxID=4537 RepID=A0A0E0KMA6_ORYPU